MERKTSDHPTCQRIFHLLLQNSASPSFEWFSFAEQALNALYLMTEQPDRLCGEIIKRMSDRVFGAKAEDAQLDAVTKGMGNVGLESQRDEGSDQEEVAEEEEEEMTVKDDGKSKETIKASAGFMLAQLLFVVGHVAIKQIVHLESIETEWKRRKIRKDSTNEQGAAGSGGAGELEMVTGSAEDEFAETIAMVRERELLFGPNSLLSLYGPVIVHVLTHNQKFKVRYLHWGLIIANPIFSIGSNASNHGRPVSLQIHVYFFRFL